MSSGYSWEYQLSRASLQAREPQLFVEQHLSPLLIAKTREPSRAILQGRETFHSDEDFWTSGKLGERLSVARLERFRISDWFPRAPGVYWSNDAARARENVWAVGLESHPKLGSFYTPEGKMNLVERGGMGSIRLRPRKIDDEYCWLGTAVSGDMCHTGVPLAVPETLLDSSGVEWGDEVNLVGRVRYLQDAGLDDVALGVHHARPLILFVDFLEGVHQRDRRKPLVISPTVLFRPTEAKEWDDGHQPAGYTFAQCDSGDELDIRNAAEWMQDYSLFYSGEVITNFDQQQPTLAGAPLSYQRLLARTYDMHIVHQYGGAFFANRIESMTYLDQSTTHNYGGVHVGDTINARDNAIVNSKSVLNNVTQTIGTSNGLDGEAKAELNKLVDRLAAELENIKAQHPAETEEIAEAVAKAVGVALKPEKKKAFLDLKASNLVDAAKLAAEFAPSVVHAAGQLATFIQGLL